MKDVSNQLCTWQFGDSSLTLGTGVSEDDGEAEESRTLYYQIVGDALCWSEESILETPTNTEECWTKVDGVALKGL